MVAAHGKDGGKRLPVRLVQRSEVLHVLASSPIVQTFLTKYGQYEQCIDATTSVFRPP